MKDRNDDDFLGNVSAAQLRTYIQGSGTEDSNNDTPKRMALLAEMSLKQAKVNHDRQALMDYYTKKVSDKHEYIKELDKLFKALVKSEDEDEEVSIRSRKQLAKEAQRAFNVYKKKYLEEN